MKPNRPLFFLNWFFLLLVLSDNYFENTLGSWDMLITIILFILFIILCFGLILQLLASVKEKFKSGSRNILVVSVAFVLAITIFRPSPLMDYQRNDAKDILVAERKGVAGCRAMIRLKTDKTYKERAVCFEVQTSSGSYTLSGDTVKFPGAGLAIQDDTFRLGIINVELKIANMHSKTKGSLYLYKSSTEKIPSTAFEIVKDEMGK